jgi:2-polyprenyl-3-methyl-5-hydroxy-6-metoxy-1,4-benzoquinol methylase
LGRTAFLYIDAHTNAAEFFETSPFDPSWIIESAALGTINWECIILDRFQTPMEELIQWMRLAPVIGIDEGGSYKDHFDFLIDILPGINRITPNIRDVSLLPLPREYRRKNVHGNTPRKVLISFGQEDAAGLGLITAKALSAQNDGSMEITLLRGKLAHNHEQASGWGNVRIMPAIPRLAESLGEYDVIITHYGITAFEALYAGTPVLLINPTPYHEQLSKAAGFITITNRRLSSIPLFHRVVYLQKKLESRCAALARRYDLDHAPVHSWAELVNHLAIKVNNNCLVCGASLYGTVIARFAERTYLRCKTCGVINMNRLTPPPIEYAKEYFFEGYKKQYGKTYIEDFPNLIAMGKGRLAVIKPLLATNDSAPLLLDIGCAYGPFLAAAREEGFSPFGIDPADDAVRYVTQTLGIPATQGFFPSVGNREWGVGSGNVDVVSLWYVIEHLRDCVPALAEIRKLLRPGGVLAFSTPSFAGISGRASLKRFLERSPADHWTIWSPATCRKALKMAGFKVRKIVVCGHHPERFPLLGRYAQGKKSPMYGILMAASRIFGLGDTFEIYAVRE